MGPQLKHQVELEEEEGAEGEERCEITVLQQVRGTVSGGKREGKIYTQKIPCLLKGGFVLLALMQLNMSKSSLMFRDFWSLIFDIQI